MSKGFLGGFEMRLGLCKVISEPIIDYPRSVSVSLRLCFVSLYDSFRNIRTIVGREPDKKSKPLWNLQIQGIYVEDLSFMRVRLFVRSPSHNGPDVFETVTSEIWKATPWSSSRKSGNLHMNQTVLSMFSSRSTSIQLSHTEVAENMTCMWGTERIR